MIMWSWCTQCEPILSDNALTARFRYIFYNSFKGCCLRHSCVNGGLAVKAGSPVAAQTLMQQMTSDNQMTLASHSARNSTAKLL